MAQAVELGNAGMWVSAERAARIAERLLRADAKLGEAAEGEDTTDYIAELRRLVMDGAVPDEEASVETRPLDAGGGARSSG